MNKVIISGRLTKDVEFRSTEIGTSVARFTVATNRNFKNKEGNYDADFISCVAYRNSADFIAKYFKKGSGIIVDGRIQTGSYEAQDGTKRYTTDVVVENVEFNGTKKEDTQSEPQEEIQIPQNIKSNYKEEEITLTDADLPF